MDIVAPGTVTFTTQFGAPAPGNSPGEVVEAKVMQLLADGRARLALANTLIDVVSSVPLAVGATVRVAVRHTLEGIRLGLIEPGLTGAKAIVPLVVDGPSQAALEAAFPVGGSHTRAPAGQFTAGHVTAGHVTADAARLNASSSASMPQVPSPPVSPAAVNAAALAQAVRGAAVRQSGLAPLMADLAVALRSPSLPAAVTVAAAQVLALRVPVADGLPAAALKQAFARSGLFLEAGLASGADAPADLKTALLTLRQVLRAFMAADAGVPVRSEMAAPPMRAPPLVPAGPMPEQASAQPVPPPYRGAPTTAQPELPPAIAIDTPAEEIGRVLLRDTEGALGRQTLLQAASLPERPSHADAAGGPRWHFEIPFATPQGLMIAQFEIARDGHGTPAEGTKAVWRARFSVDVEPLGAIHAQVALIGERAAVTLWAERPEAAARFRAGVADLKAALAEAELEPDIMIRDGAPPRPREAAAPAGRFLDRAT
ncbi:flagellar hook-length control protein FliK [Xanthobacteraceae bacterium Astr-EGSB]|uniref:flagellar hook-length control protein FliK n=1 Tax=Astrobacterium formosum TaxID=3069710 RepID=UPI0027B3F329|nr:flagellar hook-length control protein FliK [Xanthobacteraceae bacterium Astr-EGSB]